MGLSIFVPRLGRSVRRLRGGCSPCFGRAWGFDQTAAPLQRAAEMLRPQLPQFRRLPAAALPPPPPRSPPHSRPRLSGCSAAVFRTPAFRSGPDAPAVPFRALSLRQGESGPLFAPRAAFWPIPRTAGGVLQGHRRAFGRGGRKSGKKGASPSSPEKGDAGRRPERGSEKTAAARPRRAGQAAGRRGRAPARVSPPSTRPSKRPASASSTSGTMERNSPRPTAVLR